MAVARAVCCRGVLVAVTVGAEGLHSKARQCFESARELTRCISHGTGGRGGDKYGGEWWRRSRLLLRAGDGVWQVAMARGNEVFDELLAKAAADMERALQLDDD